MPQEFTAPTSLTFLSYEQAPSIIEMSTCVRVFLSVLITCVPVPHQHV